MALPALALGALIGGGVGGLKHFLVDKPAADKERQYQAETARWSPWTGLQSKYVRDPSLFGNMLQGGMGGAAFGQLAGMGAAPGVSGVGPVASGAEYAAMVEEPALSSYYGLSGMKNRFPGREY